MNLSIIVFGLLQHTPLSKMKKIIPLSIFILTALVLKAQEFDDRLFVKFSESELIEMQTNQIEEFKYINACLDHGFYLANFKGKSNPAEVIGEIMVDDLSKINFFELGVTPVENRYLYYKIKGHDKLLVVRSVEHIKGNSKSK